MGSLRVDLWNVTSVGFGSGTRAGSPSRIAHTLGGGFREGHSPARIRCAIYTRKSTDEGLDQAFNSLDAQREAADAYVLSQKAEGWEALPDRYDDGGCTGANMERPGLKRLLGDIQARLVDCVVVYKLDRLSRSMRDFFRIFEVFEDHDVAFVSVTQAFNTTSPVGRMTMNILLSFSQFEREQTAERTRDKVRAARRRGRFTGGFLVLGYDRHADGGRLVVNEAEAKRVRQIFRLFLKNLSIVEVVQDLNRRGWTLKRWTTKEGCEVGGGSFDKHSLRRLLTNPLYVGRVHFDGQVYAGADEAIVDVKTWDRVQDLLTDGARGPRRRSTRSTSLLGGILRCGACDCAMTPTYSQKGRVRYRYFVCNKAHRRGHATCPSPTVKATDIEAFVVEKIRAIGKDEELVARTIEEASARLEARRGELETEIGRVRKRLERAHAEMREDLASVTRPVNTAPPSAKMEGRIQDLEDRLAGAQVELTALRAQRIDAGDLRAALQAFDPVWANLTTEEQARVVQLLIERIDYDGSVGRMAITFRPTGVRTLAKEARA